MVPGWLPFLSFTHEKMNLTLQGHHRKFDTIRMREKILYTPAEVKSLIETGGAILIDTRGNNDYRNGHIPGAAHETEFFTYLSMTTPAGLAALRETFTGIFSRLGVSENKPVIFYEHKLDGCYGCSCRAYWLLTYLGHPAVGILDGGFLAWQQDASRAIDSTPASPHPVKFIARPQKTIMATQADVLAAVNNPGAILLDNRDEPEWLGLSSSPYTIDFAPRKGRIPGAIWIEWYEFMDRTRRVTAFKTPESIRSLCASRGIHPGQDIIIYCFKGCRAANTYVAMKLSGFTNLRVYFGSWNEWSRDPSLPVSAGTP